jgi:hypothetical protein
MITFHQWLMEAATQQQVEGFTIYPYTLMKEISNGELMTEYREEILPEIQGKSSNSMLRWGVNPREAAQIFGDEQHFIQLARGAKPQVLPPSVLRNVRNYGQVSQIIDAYLSNPNLKPSNVQQQQQQFFGNIDPATGKGQTGNQMGRAEMMRMQQGGYTKQDSYLHKVDLVTGNQPVIYPLLLHHKNQYSHISGHTRQTAAVSHKIILPVKVIES